MRKISLTNGRVAVEILPDCGGAISVLRWIAPDHTACDLLRPARKEDIQAAHAPGMSCIPLSPFIHTDRTQDDPAEWTVQDASNIRATLTLHTEAGGTDGPAASCQLLQRFELSPDGLRLQLTITNIGVRPLPVRAGLRLRPELRGECLLRGAISHMDGPDQNRDLTPATLSAGYRLGTQALHVRLHQLRRDIRLEWPEGKIALSISPLQGFDIIGLDYSPAEREFSLTPLSDVPAGAGNGPDGRLLQQGDSLSAALLLSPVSLAA